MTDAMNARRTASALSVLAAGMRHFSPAIECVSVQLLKPYPRNARRHSRAQIKQIAASIERFGFNNPVLIADDGEIVAGHGRVAASKASQDRDCSSGASVAPKRGGATRLCDRRQQTCA